MANFCFEGANILKADQRLEPTHSSAASWSRDPGCLASHHLADPGSQEASGMWLVREPGTAASKPKLRPKRECFVLCSRLGELHGEQAGAL